MNWTHARLLGKVTVIVIKSACCLVKVSISVLVVHVLFILFVRMTWFLPRDAHPGSITIGFVYILTVEIKI